MITSYVPPGYMRTHLALEQAIQTWFREELAACEPETAPPQESSGDPLNDAFIWQAAEEQRQRAAERRVEPILLAAAKRFRDALYEGRLVAFYPSPSGGSFQGVPSGWWASSQADGACERGEYEPFGPPARFGQRYVEPLYVLEADLIALLDEKGAEDGNKGNKQVAKRVTAQMEACRQAVAALWKDGIPGRDTRTNQRLVAAVQDHLRGKGSIVPDATTILRETGRRSRAGATKG